MGNEGKVRRPKVDAADAKNQSEAFLPGQRPVQDAESEEADLARRTEQQPDPVAAAIAVNPEFLSGVESERAGVQHQEIKNAVDRDKGER